MSDWVKATCVCCEVPQQVRVWVDERSGEAMCDPCAGHRGSDPENNLKRAEAHAAMFRQRCDAARNAATLYEDKMKAAFRSRDHAVRILRSLDEIHVPNRRGCACGVKDCRSRAVLDGSWVRDMLRRLAVREHDERLRDGWWDEDEDDALTETIYPTTWQSERRGLAG